MALSWPEWLKSWRVYVFSKKSLLWKGLWKRFFNHLQSNATGTKSLLNKCQTARFNYKNATPKRTNMQSKPHLKTHKFSQCFAFILFCFTIALWFFFLPLYRPVIWCCGVVRTAALPPRLLLCSYLLLHTEVLSWMRQGASSCSHHNQ